MYFMNTYLNICCFINHLFEQTCFINHLFEQHKNIEMKHLAILPMLNLYTEAAHIILILSMTMNIEL